jgi:exodeoxyribonuclease VII small subunit
MAKTKGKAPEEMTYELAFQELQQIVASLESGKMPLDEALKLFERGQALADRCSELLEQAELRLKQLVPDEGGGYREEDLDLEEE